MADWYLRGRSASPMPAACSAAPSAVYRRRHPERSVLYRVMQENLESWLAHRQAAEADSGGVPSWVEGELRRYLKCGILAWGLGAEPIPEIDFDQRHGW